MIEIDPLNEDIFNFYPQLCPHAKYQLRNADRRAVDLVRSSHQTWVVRADNILYAVAGIVRLTYVGNPPLLWLLYGKHILDHKVWTVRNAKALLPELLRDYPTVRTLVQKGFGTGRKFVKLLGFEQVGETDRAYIYEVRNGI